MKIEDLIGEATAYDKKRELERKEPLSWLKRVNASFETLRTKYLEKTQHEFVETDFASFGLVAKGGLLTNAGALLADGALVRHSRVFCTRWNGVTKSHGTLDAHDDDEFSGGLLTILAEALRFARNNSKNPWRKLPNGVGRVNYPEYPMDAVEECIVNGLIHRDYLEIGSEVHIDIFDDRMEIFSPGGMPSGEFIQDLDTRSVPSTRRNPVIADLFQRLDLMERRGSGFGKVLDAYEFESKKRGLAVKPTFRSTATGFFVILPNLNRDFSMTVSGGKTVMETVTDTTPETTTGTTTVPTTVTTSVPTAVCAPAATEFHDEKTLSERLGRVSAKIYRMIISNNRLTASEMARRLKISEDGVRYHLKKIKTAGLVRYVGNPQKNGHWEGMVL